MCTGCDPTTSATVLRGQKDGTRCPVACPPASAIYNQHMGGVDLGDQLRGYYHMQMKCRKFYQYVAKFLLDVAITNSYILYKLTHPGTKCTVLTFREVLSKELVGYYCSRRRPGRSSNLIRISRTPTDASSVGDAPCTWRVKDSQWFCHDCGVWLRHPGTVDDHGNPPPPTTPAFTTLSSQSPSSSS
jgi:hypothetical protein